MPTETRSMRPIGIVLPCATLGFLIFYLLKPSALLIAGAVVAFVFLAIFIRWPETATLTALFLLYTNIAVLVMRPPTIDAAAAGPRTAIALIGLWMMFVASMLYQLYGRKQPLVFDR